ncbi:hypothetical protein SAMN05443662_1056 [Sulfurivirga caldicuralii]|uniref:Uncharacterized protein n=1 Tax=Sulfurivirga caldicuralii TaxID=364032 RepID=A0A1N6FFG4_9GAMM|nr:hypothetical protein [Sulfurivirga caldicuralii]SIN93936.1 hypothetical protein SAMN05443662_1056 [Sulfurivirga caldicuralii]
MNIPTTDMLHTAMNGLNRQFASLNEDALRMTPNNPEGFEKPLVDLNQHTIAAQVQLKAVKSWNENIGRLLDILA